MNNLNLDELNSNLHDLNDKIEKQLSWKFIILKGFVHGVSIVIGTTILAGIVLSLLNNVPVVEEVIDRFMIEDGEI